MNFKLYSKGREIKDGVLLRKVVSDEVGIFESMRVYNGKIFREREHLARLAESARTAGFALPPLETLAAELKNSLRVFLALLGRKRDIFVRLSLWKGETFVLLGDRHHAPSLYKKGISLKTSAVPRSISNAGFPEAKTAAYQNAMMASLEPALEPGGEWLFLDRNHLVAEVRTGNLFIIKKNELKTPPAAGILNGITRAFVIEFAAETGLRVGEVPLTRHDVWNADEAFLTNTSWEILPVASLDGRTIGKKIPGPGTKKLQSLFKKKVLRECQK